MKKFTAIYKNEPHRNFTQTVRGVCQFDVLNPCWDNRPTDVPGKHWGGGEACTACTEAAAQHSNSFAATRPQLTEGEEFHPLTVFADGEEEKFLTVEVYRHADPKWGDCTCDGITSRFTTVAVPHREGYITLDDLKKRNTPICDIIVRPYLKNYIHARPREVAQGTHSMFGGNYIASSDSRISRINQYPIGVHDRVER